MDRACVVGGGFYGAAIALHLKTVRNIVNVTVIEQESHLLARASFANQARVHNGYHYPRSFTTAHRSHANFARFNRDWQTCIRKDFDKYYALARRNSKVTAIQFRRFCDQIGAPVMPAERQVIRLFNPRLIESVYKVEEYAFDACMLRRWFAKELKQAGVDILLNHSVFNVRQDEAGDISFCIRDASGGISSQSTPLLFNCTYSGLAQIRASQSNTRSQLKHEIAELALIDVPDSLFSFAVTVMDGPFFSVMPFPARHCHSLSHVRYTPHCQWLDQPGSSPYQVLAAYPCQPRVDRMLRDASRFLPILAFSQYRESLFEVKTVLTQNEADDGRPILVQQDDQVRGMLSVLGSKIDNIYDILDAIDTLVDWQR